MAQAPYPYNPGTAQGLAVWLSDTGFFQEAVPTAVGGVLPPTTVGQPVRFWRDQSGNNNHAVLASSTAPTFAPGSVNGRDAVQFSGMGGDGLVIPNLTLPSPFTIFIAFNTRFGAPDIDIVGGTGNYLGVHGAGLALRCNGIPVPSNRDPYATGHVMQGTFIAPPRLMIDGAYSATTGVGAIQSLMGLGIGAPPDSGFPSGAQISEIIVLSQVPTATDAAGITNYLLNKYSQFKYLDIINSIRSTLISSGAVTPANAFASILFEPFPIGEGPTAFVIPGSQQVIKPQQAGAGRYYYGMSSMATIRVVDRCSLDEAYVDTIALTDSSIGLLRTAHDIIRATHLDMPLGPGGIPLLEEPMVLTQHGRPSRYRGDSGWRYVDLIYQCKYQSRLFELSPDLTTGPPQPTNLADVLLGIRSMLIGAGIFWPNQSAISLSRDPYPVSEPPFCIISPSQFAFVPGHTYGAGKAYASMIGSVVIDVITASYSDITGRADLALGASLSGLFKVASAVVERLQLSMPVKSGIPLTEDKVYLREIGAPAYYRLSSKTKFAAAVNLITVPLAFSVQYQQDLV